MIRTAQVNRVGERNSASRTDAGFTLPELVVSISVTSILITAIAAALIGMLNVSTQATTQLSEAKDVSFVQTRVPVDLGSALAASDQLSTAYLASDLGAQLTALGLAAPSLVGLDGLPGSNVLTIIRPNVSVPGAYLVVAYRYEQRGADWVINRYQFSPGTATPGPIVNLVATELAAPPLPTGPAVTPWQPGDAVGFAAQVSPQSLGDRPAGREIELTFASGRTFTTGGAGLSAVRSLPPANFPGLNDPLAPPSRCGSRIAIVVDTSGSVPQGSGGANTEAAAIGFINGFVGTPTQISLNGFDQTGYGMSIDLSNPATRDQRAPFYSVLNDGPGSPEAEGMRTRIAALDDTDGQWASGGSTISPGNPSNRRDPDGNGIYYGQVGDGTNWQGGLWSLFKNQQNQVYASDLPDLVVFITDGQPNIVRTGPGTVSGTSESAARDAAVLTANELKTQTNARLVGVMVGNKRTNSTYVGYLKDVVGNSAEWNGIVGAGSNAETAGVFLGSFDQLGDILRSIVIGECGGTVTLQKRVDTAGTLTMPSSGVWKYSSSVDGDSGSRTLDRAATSSVTFDYTFGSGVGTKTVQLTEEPVDGLVWDRAECTVGGLPLASVPNSDGSPGVTVNVDASAAVSCLMISRPA